MTSARSVRIAVIDSGVHASHPHIGGISGGIGIDEHGMPHDDYVDRLGHGTAVTAAIREKAPDALLAAIKVFWRSLSTDIGSLVRGVDEGSRRAAAVINLSLGTSKPAHRPQLEAAVERARQQNALIVAAGEDEGVAWLPGVIPGVIPVQLDWDCPRDEYRVDSRNGRTVVATSGYPRDIPGVPRERNLKGLSFAVANVSGFVARALEAQPGATIEDVFEILKSQM